MAAPAGAPIGALRGAIDLSPLVSRGVKPPTTERPSPRAPSAGGSDDGAVSDVIMEVGDADFARVVELSRSVPVIVALVAEWSTPSRELLPVLSKAVQAQGGRLVLAIVDSDQNPQFAGAFQAQAVPTVAAVVAGAPVSLFTGAATEAQLAALLPQVLELAAQHGVTGSIGAGGESASASAAATVPVEAPLPPHHAEAYDAIDRQDYVEAAQQFRTAIAQDPRDLAAVAALAQVELLQRLTGAEPQEVRQRAAALPDDVEAQLAVADLDLAGGHVDDAFDRVLGVFGRVAGDARTVVRTRLLGYFEIVGVDDPRVGVARRRLAMLLY